MKNKTICWLFIFILMIHHNNDITAETIACLFFSCEHVMASSTTNDGQIEAKKKLIFVEKKKNNKWQQQSYRERERELLC